MNPRYAASKKSSCVNGLIGGYRPKVTYSGTTRASSTILGPNFNDRNLMSHRITNNQT